MDFDVLQKLFSIVIVNLVLSGDNAVVIAMAARRLPEENRRKAILWGGAGAIVLRIILTAIAALLLDIPLLQAIGGILLVYISIRLITPEPEHHDAEVKQPGSIGQAVQTILVADLVMSLDNIIAVGGTAEGELGLLLIGLVLSIALILVGSSLVAKLLEQYPWLLILGVLVLLHAAVKMFLHDHFVEKLFGYHHAPEWVSLAIAPVLTVIVLVFVRAWRGGIAGFTDRDRAAVTAARANDPSTTRA
ncbi:MAG TPA: TerC family protein [Thermomicrobiales bacterium]|nr:TerC family protein [Thermomicrobiales bacterium]